MNHIRAKTGLALLIAAALTASALGQQWYDYAPTPNYFDWQLFAPIDDLTPPQGLLDSEPAPPGSEGYFFNADTFHAWLMRPGRASIGAPIANPQAVFIPTSVNYAYLPDGTTQAPSTLVPAVLGGAFGFQFNSIGVAVPTHTSGNGNRFEFGWIGDDGKYGHHGGETGWMISILVKAGFGSVYQYGYDDKRLRQLGAAQGLDGMDGVPSTDGTLPPNQTRSTAPVGPVGGIPSIPAFDGLETVGVFFEDPFNLLLGFVDVNGDFIPDDLNNNGVIGDVGAFPFGDQARIGVVFDELQVTNRMIINGGELMAIRRKKRLFGGAMAEVFVGARYLQLDDNFDVIGRGGALGDTEIDNEALNRIVGPQFGFRIAKRTNRWTSSFKGRFMAGANFLSIRQNGYIGNHLPTFGNFYLGDPNGSGLPTGVPNGFGGNEYAERLSDARFSPVGEFKYEIALDLTQKVALKADWTGLMVGGVARAANTVRYRLPSMGIINRSEEMFAHGVGIGLEFNR